MQIDIQVQAESLAHKIKHYLITTMGVTLNEANAEEFYRSFALTLREEIMICWTACTHTYRTAACAHALLSVYGIHARAVFG